MNSDSSSNENMLEEETSSRVNPSNSKGRGNKSANARKGNTNRGNRGTAKRGPIKGGGTRTPYGTVTTSISRLPDSLTRNEYSHDIEKVTFPINSENQLVADYSIEYVNLSMTGSPNSEARDGFNDVMNQFLGLCSRVNLFSNFTTESGQKFKLTVDELEQYFTSAQHFLIVYHIFSELTFLNDSRNVDAPSTLKRYASDNFDRIGNIRSVRGKLHSTVREFLLPPEIINLVKEMFGFKVIKHDLNDSLIHIKGISIPIDTQMVEDYNIKFNPEYQPKVMCLDTLSNESSTKVVGQLNFPPLTEDDALVFRQYLKGFCTKYVDNPDSSFNKSVRVFESVAESWRMTGYTYDISAIPVLSQWVSDVYHNLPVLDQPQEYVLKSASGKGMLDGVVVSSYDDYKTVYVKGDEDAFYLNLSPNLEKDMRTALFSLRTVNTGFEINRFDYKEDKDYEEYELDNTHNFTRSQPGVITRLPLFILNGEGQLEKVTRAVITKQGKPKPVRDLSHLMSMDYRFTRCVDLIVNRTCTQRRGYTLPFPTFVHELEEIFKFYFDYETLRNADVFTQFRKSK